MRGSSSPGSRRSTPRVAYAGSYKRLKAAETRFGLLLTLPALLVFSLVIFYPFVRSIVISLFADTLFTPTPVLVGVQNFVRVLNDPLLVQTWVTTLVFVVVATALTLVLGLAWAVMLNQPVPGRSFIRSLSLLPWIFPSTVVAFLWAWIFNAQYGVLNGVLLELGLIQQRVPWLSQPTSAMSAVIVAKVWAAVPFFMAFYTAALQTLPQDQLDAARVDGAGNRQLFKHVVMPHLKYITVILAILGAIANLQQFDIIYAMTEGGPVRATTVLSIEVFKQAFQNFNMGLAAALGVLWLITIAIPAFFYLRSIFQTDT